MSSSSSVEWDVDATSICGIVYELSRLAHDRQQMQHEDRVGRLLFTLQQQTQKYEWLKAELQIKDETIDDLQRQIAKNKKTGMYVPILQILYNAIILSCVLLGF